MSLQGGVRESNSYSRLHKPLSCRWTNSAIIGHINGLVNRKVGYQAQHPNQDSNLDKRLWRPFVYHQRIRIEIVVLAQIKISWDHGIEPCTYESRFSRICSHRSANELIPICYKPGFAPVPMSQPWASFSFKLLIAGLKATNNCNF